jgi:hypothetical protein
MYPAPTDIHNDNKGIGRNLSMNIPNHPITLLSSLKRIHITSHTFAPIKSHILQSPFRNPLWFFNLFQNIESDAVEYIFLKFGANDRNSCLIFIGSRGRTVNRSTLIKDF